jgi:pyrroline-5-carboxylate reductase
LTLKQSIAFAGAGNMGEAILRGLLRSSTAPANSIHAADLDQARLHALAADTGIQAHPSAAQAAQAADIILLCAKPQAFPALCAELKPVLSPAKLCVSIAAGLPLAKLEAALGPGVPVIRVMPNTPALVAKGASAYCLGASAGEAHAQLVEAIFRPLGLVLPVQEAAMDAVTALSGSGPAYVFLFMEALQAAGESLGLDAQASFALASQTLAGAAEMIIQRKDTPARLREKVTSPGGTTAAALKVLEDAGFRDLVKKAVAAARDRSVELGR